jgi:hypothetical protein
LISSTNHSIAVLNHNVNHASLATLPMLCPNSLRLVYIFVFQNTNFPTCTFLNFKREKREKKKVKINQ